MNVNTSSKCLLLTKAFFDKKLDLDIFQLKALHHLIEMEICQSKCVSDLMEKLKLYKLDLQREILSLQNGMGQTMLCTTKRKRFRNLDTDALLKKLNS